MEHSKIIVEYPLTAKSPTIVWDLISTASGLEKWMADYVEEVPGGFSFTWGELWTQRETKVSKIIKMDTNKKIRLKWEDQEEEGDYWEMKIEKSELTGTLTLVITDFAPEDEEDDIRDLWDKNLERLHRTSGL